MPIYKFIPVDFFHPSWSASTYKGRCRVHAPDERRARHYLHVEFFDLLRRDKHWLTQTSPWKEPKRTSCVEDVVGDDTNYLDGLIEVEEDGQWTVRNAGRIPTTDKEPDRGKGGHEEFTVPTPTISGGPDAAAAGGGAVASTDAGLGNLELDISLNVEVQRRVVQPLSRETVTRAVRNRVVLQFQASRLIDYLDGLIRPKGAPEVGRNAQSPTEALGITEGITDAELLALLKDLRDELRRFNDALEKGEFEPGALVKFRDMALKSAAVAFGTTVGAGAGGLVATALGGLLDSANLVEWENFIEFVKAVRGGG